MRDMEITHIRAMRMLRDSKLLQIQNAICAFDLKMIDLAKLAEIAAFHGYKEAAQLLRS